MNISWTFCTNQSKLNGKEERREKKKTEFNKNCQWQLCVISEYNCRHFRIISTMCDVWCSDSYLLVFKYINLYAYWILKVFCCRYFWRAKSFWFVHSVLNDRKRTKTSKINRWWRRWYSESWMNISYRFISWTKCEL